MNEQIRIRIQDLRLMVKRLISADKNFVNRRALKDINGLLDYGILFHSSESGMEHEAEDAGFTMIGLIRQQLEKYEDGNSASPYGAWTHAYPFKMKYLSLLKSTQLQLPI